MSYSSAALNIFNIMIVEYHSLAEREGMTVDASDIEGGSSDDNSGPGTTMIKKHKKRKPKSKVITLKAHGHS